MQLDLSRQFHKDIYVVIDTFHPEKMTAFVDLQMAKAFEADKPFGRYTIERVTYYT